MESKPELQLMTCLRYLTILNLYLLNGRQVLLPVAMNCEEKGQSAMILSIKELTDQKKGQVERYVINYV